MKIKLALNADLQTCYARISYKTWGTAEVWEWNYNQSATYGKSSLIGTIQSGFTEGSFLLLNGQKEMRSVAEDLISSKQ